MYRCEVCKCVSEPRQPRKVHIIYRTVSSTRYRAKDTGGRGLVAEPYLRTEIAREIPVCHGCKDLLDQGISLPRLREVVAHTIKLQAEQGSQVTVIPSAPRKHRRSKESQKSPGGFFAKGVAADSGDEKPWKSNGTDNSTTPKKRRRPKTKSQRKQANGKTLRIDPAE